jgi:hypothetical protein
MKKKQNNLNNINFAVALVLLLVGFSSGFLVNNLMVSKTASTQELEQAKTDIARLYKGKTVKACWEVNKGSNLAADKYELNYRNLRINKYADRAIISDCSDYDTLLYKNKSGQWVQTTVNLQIGNRVNPVWQKECGIEDITVADDMVRPENGSIDQMNLEECRQVNDL